MSQATGQELPNTYNRPIDEYGLDKPSNAYVLESLDWNSEHDGYVFDVSCPSCSQVVDKIETPLKICYETWCEKCNIRIDRDFGVAVRSDKLNQVSEQEIRQAIEYFWTFEYQKRDITYRKKTLERIDKKFEDVGLSCNVSCPICSTPVNKCTLEYHHWDYENDDGVLICSECHNFISSGKKIEEMDDYARKLGLSNWKQATVMRAAIRFERERGIRPTAEDIRDLLNISMAVNNEIKKIQRWISLKQEIEWI